MHDAGAATNVGNLTDSAAKEVEQAPQQLDMLVSVAVGETPAASHTTAHAAAPKKPPFWQQSLIAGALVVAALLFVM